MESPLRMAQPLSELSQNQQTQKPNLSEEDQLRFNKLVKKAKEIAAQGQLKQSLELYNKALKIYDSEKLRKRVGKIEEYLHQCGSSSESEEGDDMVHVGDGFSLYKDLYEKLYEHQRQGVLWFWSLYKKRKGGVLGDDMGLGKTIQVIAFLSGMFDAQKVHAVLIVLPVAVICNWEKEFEKWSPGIRVLNFHGGSRRDRERVLLKVSRRGGVCLTSYGMLVNNADQLATIEGKEFKWDFVILDEGHKIKNPSVKCSKGVHRIGARNRVILTGTPIQNNLKEMWALFDWTNQGALLGTATTFSMEYDKPITRARQKDATAGEQRLGSVMAESLKKIIAPYFLRRTKAEVKKGKDEAVAANLEDNTNHAPEMPTLTHKNDLICWVYLSQDQQRIYEDFLGTEEVKELLNSTKSPLMSLTILKKICDHPRLLSLNQCHALGLDVDDGSGGGSSGHQQSTECAATRIDIVDNQTLIAESGKMVFLVELLDNLKAEGHRCLVFSQSLKILNIIQKVMSDRGHRIARLDGSIHIQEREEIIKRFTKNREYSIFLLTTQVGGVGLTLTAADRVVIYDPSWNPATDAQAVDRVFRIGQQKDVVVYRLITCGSIEEKIYRRQVFKDSINKQTTGESNNPYRYFTSTQLKDLFVLDNPRESSTHQQLSELHQNMRRTDTSLDAHIAFLHTLDMLGISDHDLMFNQEAYNDELEEEEHGMGAEYIQGRVHKAQQQLAAENRDTELNTEKTGQYLGPQKVDRGPRLPPSIPSTSHPPPLSQPPMYQPPNWEPHISPPGHKESKISPPASRELKKSPPQPLVRPLDRILAAVNQVVDLTSPTALLRNVAATFKSYNSTPVKVEEGSDGEGSQDSDLPDGLGSGPAPGVHRDPSGHTAQGEEDDIEENELEKTFDRMNVEESDYEDAAEPRSPTPIEIDSEDDNMEVKYPGRPNGSIEDHSGRHASSEDDMELGSPVKKPSSTLQSGHMEISPSRGERGQTEGFPLPQRLTSPAGDFNPPRTNIGASLIEKLGDRSLEDVKNRLKKYGSPSSEFTGRDMMEETENVPPSAGSPAFSPRTGATKTLHTTHMTPSDTTRAHTVVTPDRSVQNTRTPARSVTKSARKKRLSVCIMNPSRPLLYDDDTDTSTKQTGLEGEIRREELVFSPQPNEPISKLVQARPRGMLSPPGREGPTCPAGDILENTMAPDYASFKTQVNPKFNSTSIFDLPSSRPDIPRLSSLAEGPSSPHQSPGGSASDTEDSPVVAGRRKKAVVRSDSEGEAEDHREYQPVGESDSEAEDEEDSGHQEDITSPGHHQQRDSSGGRHQENVSHHQDREPDDGMELGAEAAAMEGGDIEEEEEEDEEELDPEDEEKYINLISTSRKLYKQNQFEEALGYALDALEIYSGDPKAQQYALKLQRKLAISQ